MSAAWTLGALIAAGLAGMALPARSAPAPQPLRIGDGRDWAFVASKWKDAADGAVVGERDGDGAGLQGYAMAFQRSKSYRDLEAEFTVCMPAGHADIGLIVRAQDPRRFYLIHFPQCGQAYRAQHFWAALSVADGSGYLRVIKLEHVRRVASSPFGLKHRARVVVRGDRFQVWVNGFPALDVRDRTYRSGRIGLAGFAQFAHGAVTVAGTEVASGRWKDGIEQVRNWFVPFPDAGRGQGAASLATAPNGDLLCAFTTGLYSDAPSRRLARSSDAGRTWAVGPAPANMDGDIYRLKDGRLVSIALASGKGTWAESRDSGRTWDAAHPIEPGAAAWPADPARLDTGWQFQLADGALVRFALGRHSTSTDPITRWGSVHCQAFATRSVDGGKTWSAPASLDAGQRTDMGSMDLTEPVAFETRDGRLMCLIRPIYSPWMWETWSSDGGRTWGPCVRGPFPGYAPSTPVRTASGAVVFPTRFPGLTLHVTRDEGMTWDDGGGGTYIDTSIWAMGSMLEVEKDVILFLYMDSWLGPMRAQYVYVTPSGLQPASGVPPAKR